MTTATASALSVNRRSLVRALEQVARVLPLGRSKPILQGVRLEAADGMLWLAATDLETSLLVHLPASDDLPRCVVPGRDLLKRVKSGQSPMCSLELQGEHLVINGGAVRHQLAVLPPEEYPLVQARPEGVCIEVPGDRLRQALEVALVAVARESSRYAINGVLFEVKADAYVVATDGRRMVSVNLCDGSGDETSTILPVRFCRMLLKLIPRDSEDAVHLYVKANGGPEEEKRTQIGRSAVLNELGIFFNPDGVRSLADLKALILEVEFLNRDRLLLVNCALLRHFISPWFIFNSSVANR